MSKITLQREHQLNQKESREMAENLLNKLVSKYGGKLTEDGNDFRYKHTAGVNATIEPKESEFVITVKLGIMARALGPKLEGDMNRILDEYLA